MDAEKRSMRVNIFTEDQRGPHPWILRRSALEIQKADPRITINGKPAEINYSINYALFRDVQGVLVGHFTHLEHKGIYRQRFFDTAKRYHYATCTCLRTLRILDGLGFPANRVLQVPYGSDARFKRETITFGVVGRTYKSGRKGEHLGAAAVKAGYNVRYWGKGWPCPEMFKGSDWGRLGEFYQNIDYLLVTANNEGGPVPVIDAIAAGVPVIAPNVGWCWEYPVIRYNGTWGGLHEVMYHLTFPASWERWSKAHLAFFEDIRHGRLN